MNDRSASYEYDKFKKKKNSKIEGCKESNLLKYLCRQVIDL